MDACFSCIIVIWSCPWNARAFIAGSIFAGLIAWYTSRSKKSDKKNENIENQDDDNADTLGKIDIEDVSDNASISLDLGYGLISLVDSNDKKSAGPLISKITGIRKQVSKDLGFIIPNVRVKDDLSLEANSYRIRIGLQL